MIKIMEKLNMSFSVESLTQKEKINEKPVINEATDGKRKRNTVKYESSSSSSDSSDESEEGKQKVKKSQSEKSKSVTKLKKSESSKETKYIT